MTRHIRYSLQVMFPTNVKGEQIALACVETYLEPHNEYQRFFVRSTYPDKRSYVRGFFLITDALAHAEQEALSIRALNAST